MICSEEEVDYIYKLFQDKRVAPTLAIATNPELLKDERPELYQKVKASLDRMLKELEPLLATYPPDSTIFKGPAPHLERWRSYPNLY